jgi:hypothetical protein
VVSHACDRKKSQAWGTEVSWLGRVPKSRSFDCAGRAERATGFAQDDNLNNNKPQQQQTSTTTNLNNNKPQQQQTSTTTNLSGLRCG